jgi:hypothetical protein
MLEWFNVQRYAGFPVTSPILKVQEEESVKPSWYENCTWNKAGLIILKTGITLFMRKSCERPSADSKTASE